MPSPFVGWPFLAIVEGNRAKPDEVLNLIMGEQRQPVLHGLQLGGGPFLGNIAAPIGQQPNTVGPEQLAPPSPLTIDQKRDYITQYKNLIDLSRGNTIMRLVVETYGKKSPAILYVPGIPEPHLNLAEIKDEDLLDRIFNIVKTLKEGLK